MRVSRRQFGWMAAAAASGLLRPSLLSGQVILPAIADVELQPLAEQAARVAQALRTIGAPLSEESEVALKSAGRKDQQVGVAAIQEVLDRHVLMVVTINPESRLSVARGPVAATLVQNSWTTFLVKIVNQAGVTSPFLVRSPQGGKMGRTSSLAITGVHDFTNGAVDEVEARRRWIALAMYDLPPLTPKLSGLGVEYRVLQIYSRDAGQREASLIADCGFGEQDLGFRSTLPVLFRCGQAHTIKLRLRDEHGAPCMASVLVRDALGRVYPAQGKRSLPDLAFQPQVYRADGESLLLGAGSYELLIGHGPEYLPVRKPLQVAADASCETQMTRWVEPSRFSYYSGDTHIHAAGCSHYESPSEGVTPEVMERQTLGEALDLGSVLNWGPGFAYQKQFFSGKVHPAQLTGLQANERSILRYDVEVSGFPSSHCGHLVLLRLKDDDFPSAQSIDDWPSWNIPILKWAKRQGAITGYAHSGHGLVTQNRDLPNFEMPPFDSSGANEFLVDVTHPGLIDFLSGCDLWPFAELNLWYHTLNCGYRTAFAGETDFPCITDECVGGGRTYAKVADWTPNEAGYSAWLKAFTTGDSYAGDGRSHIFNMRVESTGRSSLHGTTPSRVRISADIAAYLNENPDPSLQTISKSSPYQKPYWHIERARKSHTREVAVELIVNGRSVAQQSIFADGSIQPVSFSYQADISSWFALRIYPSAHTQPVFLEIDRKPVRSSYRSAVWCREAVDALWEQKRSRIRTSEITEATAAYDHARRSYDLVAKEASSK